MPCISSYYANKLGYLYITKGYISMCVCVYAWFRGYNHGRLLHPNLEHVDQHAFDGWLTRTRRNMVKTRQRKRLVQLVNAGFHPCLFN